MHARHSTLPYLALSALLIPCKAYCVENSPSASASAAVAVAVAARPGMAQVSGAGDFDFLMGHWQIENKKLLKPLTGADDWETFSATQHAQKLPAGIGNFDDFVPQTWRPGFVGMSLRVFNPQTQLWSIYWLNNQNGGIDAQSGTLTAPVVGRFVDGVGVFEGSEDFNGQAIRVRYTWSHISANSARWEQAFSADAGGTWETNWVMRMTRVGK